MPEQAPGYQHCNHKQGNSKALPRQAAAFMPRTAEKKPKPKLVFRSPSHSSPRRHPSLPRPDPAFPMKPNKDWSSCCKSRSLHCLESSLVIAFQVLKAVPAMECAASPHAGETETRITPSLQFKSGSN